MDIVRNADGTLVVPEQQEGEETNDSDDEARQSNMATTRVLHPGEGGYDEALAEWDSQQDPASGAAISTASGREEAISVVHEVAESPNHDVAPALEHVHDVQASAEALRHVRGGGVHAVED